MTECQRTYNKWLEAENESIYSIRPNQPWDALWKSHVQPALDFMEFRADQYGCVEAEEWLKKHTWDPEKEIQLLKERLLLADRVVCSCGWVFEKNNNVLGPCNSCGKGKL